MQPPVFTANIYAHLFQLLSAGSREVLLDNYAPTERLRFLRNFFFTRTDATILAARDREFHRLIGKDQAPRNWDGLRLNFEHPSQNSIFDGIHY